MQIGNNMLDRYYTPYKTNTNVKAISGFSLNADEKIEFGEVSEAQEGKRFIAEFVDYQKFHKEWMSQGSATAFSDTTNKGLNVEENSISLEEYAEYLKEKYGSVMVKSVGKDQSSMDSLGASTSGTGNIVIAPNILEEMASNSEKAAYYEEKIRYFLDSIPRYQAELSAMGHEIHSCGIVIHPDGTVTHYISGDLKPEVRAKIEAQVKAEQEEKAKRRQQYMELSQKAAEKRRQAIASAMTRDKTGYKATEAAKPQL